MRVTSWPLFLLSLALNCARVRDEDRCLSFCAGVDAEAALVIGSRRCVCIAPEPSP